MGYSELALFQLIGMGFLKALFFLCRGVAIHMKGNSQNIRKPSLLTLTAIFFKRVIFLRRLALIGLPLLGASLENIKFPPSRKTKFTL